MFVFLQGMMGNNMPMSPDALSPGGKPANGILLISSTETWS
jgi:hypothetical protein